MQETIRSLQTERTNILLQQAREKVALSLLLKNAETSPIVKLKTKTKKASVSRKRSRTIYTSSSEEDNNKNMSRTRVTTPRLQTEGPTTPQSMREGSVIRTRDTTPPGRVISPHSPSLGGNLSRPQRTGLVIESQIHPERSTHANKQDKITTIDYQKREKSALRMRPGLSTWRRRARLSCFSRKETRDSTILGRIGHADFPRLGSGSDRQQHAPPRTPTEVLATTISLPPCGV